MARASGQSAGEEEARENGKELDRLVGEEKAEQPLGLTRAFQRLRTDWKSSDRDIINSVMATVDEQIFQDFDEAYGIIFTIFDIVRKHVVDEETGEIKYDTAGLPEWQRNPDGSYFEDWSRINSQHREQLQYEIITKMFQWEQRSASIWGEALFAKAQWEEAFATGFDQAEIKNGRDTVEARTARANRSAAEHRYLAVYKSMYSKKADAILRSLERLSQRLKDMSV